MRVMVLGILVFVHLVNFAAAQSPVRTVQSLAIAMARSPRADAVDLLGIPARDERVAPPLAARLAAYSSATALVCLLELGDKSPLKPVVGQIAWTALLSQFPRLVAATAQLKDGLCATALEELAVPALAMQQTVLATSALSLGGAAASERSLQKGTLLYAGRALLELSLAGPVKFKLAKLVVGFNVPAEIRSGAAKILAAAAALDVESRLAIALYRTSLGLPPLLAAIR